MSVAARERALDPAGGERAPAAGPGAGRGGQPGDAIVELCAFRVGDEEYVIDLRRIREILQPLRITQVPRAPRWLEGVMDVRGEVIPVVDVRKRLGVAGSAPRPKVLIVHLSGRVLGLIVDAVAGVVRIPRSAIGPPPPLVDAAGPRLFVGVCGAGLGGAGAEVPGARRPLEPRAAATRPASARSGKRLRLLLDVRALLEPGLDGEERT